MVIAFEKRGHPIGGALLAADVGDYREKIQPDIVIAQQLPVHGKRARRLLRRTLTFGRRSSAITTTQTAETAANIQ